MSVQTYFGENWGRYPLGPRISVTEVVRLVQSIQQLHIPQSCCLPCLSATFHIEGVALSSVNTPSNMSRESFCIHSVFDSRAKMLCLKPEYRDMMTSATDKISTCFNHLSTGNCCDDVVRNTIGRVLFPKFYGKTR